MKITEKAYAKINLSIDIVSRMDNGYHSMRMIMQSVSLHDTLDISCTPGEDSRNAVVVSTDLKYLPNDDRNIAARAAAVFFAHTGITGYKTEIAIQKRIPVCAGLGGGSTDGAAVLRGLNTLFKTGLSRQTLEKLAEAIGSDVPFCVAGGTVLAEGRGEELRDLEPLPDCHIVVCKPSFAISTPELFSKIVCDKITYRPDTAGIMDALEKGNLGNVTRRMYNVFEDVLPKGTGDIRDIKSRLLDHSALGAVMTGTGSAVIGIFAGSDNAGEAYESLRKTYAETYLARPVGRLDIL